MLRVPFVFAILCLAGPVEFVSAATLEPAVLRAGLEAEPTRLDWNASRSPTDRFIVSFLMRGLLKYDEQVNPVCDLCKSFQVSADGRTYAIELQPEISWSDGAALEAKHFVDSFRRLMNPANRFPGADEFKNVIAFTAPEKNQLRIQLREPSPIFGHALTRASIFPIRKELLKSASDSGEKHAQSAVLGPYQLAEWIRGKRLIIEGNPGFQGNRPVYRVVFSIGNHAEQVTLFRSGKLDILSNPTTDDLLKSQTQNLQVSPYWATRVLYMNVRRKPLSETGFRRALLYLLDRESLPALLRNGERRVSGLIPPGLAGHRELALVTTDRSVAEGELKRLGLGGAPVVLELAYRDGESERRLASWLGERFAKMKIVLRPRPQRDEAALRRVLESRRFDLALGVRAFGIASPLEVLRDLRTGASANLSGWTNVAYDTLVEKVLRERDPAQIAAGIDKTTQILEAQEVPLIPLGYPTQPFLLGPRVRSFAVTPFGDPDLVRIELGGSPFSR